MQNQFTANQLFLFGDRLTHRVTSVVFLLLALGCFCGTPAIKTGDRVLSSIYKMLLLSTGLGFTMSAKHSHTRWRFADTMAGNLEAAAIGGHRQSLIKSFQPIDARSAQTEKQDFGHDDDGELDPFHVKLAEMTMAGDEMSISICRTLNDYNAAAVVVAKQEGLAFDRYLLNPQKGVNYKKIDGLSKDLMINVGMEHEPMISATAGGIAIDVAREQRLFADYDDYIDGDRHPGIAVPIGADQLSRKMVWLDFTDPNTPHLLIGGVTGGGKSELLRCMAKYATENYTKADVQLFGLDVKRSSFGSFANADNFTLVEDPVACVATLCRLVKIMEQRRERRNGYKDIKDYNASSPTPMSRVVAIVEELKDCLDGLKTLSSAQLEQLTDAYQSVFEGDQAVGYTTKDMKPDALVLLCLSRIGQAGRSEGIHIVVCTQEPDKKLLDNLIGNLPAKVGLRLNSYIESDVILPKKNARCDRLMGKGDLIYLCPGENLRRCQSLFVG
jgi:DNA segregation ATPase FtsK/SpoIIIE, S-DNA-T family